MSISLLVYLVHTNLNRLKNSSPKEGWDDEESVKQKK